MHYTLLRNATAVLSFGGKRFLIDPALDPAAARPPVENTPNQRPNPLVGLPDGWELSIAHADAAIVTHLHRDHFDDAAVRSLDRTIPMFGQPEDRERLAAHGFTNLRPVDEAVRFGDVEMIRTGGEHGTGDIGRQMAPVSGFLLRAPDEPVLYIAGDTIWCEPVERIIRDHRPQAIVVNAGGARFLQGDPIVMTADDIAKVHAAAPEALVVIVHLEAINHCIETRDYYRAELPRLGVDMALVRIPDDGETIRW